MPNHLHGILWIMDHPEGRSEEARRTLAPGNLSSGPKSGAIGAIIAGFKSATTRRFNQRYTTSGISLWQRNYYEHVIRDGNSLDRIRHYIAENPSRWQFDANNPDATIPDPEEAWRF